MTRLLSLQNEHAPERAGALGGIFFIFISAPNNARLVLMLERKDIDNLANLARIALSDSEKDKLQKDMDSILGYVSELQKAPVSAEGFDVAKPEDYYLRNVMREDTDPFESGLNTEIILSQAPKRKDNFFVTKKILGDSLS